jgi:hypothetical protein
MGRACGGAASAGELGLLTTRCPTAAAEAIMLRAVSTITTTTKPDPLPAAQLFYGCSHTVLSTLMLTLLKRLHFQW